MPVLEREWIDSVGVLKFLAVDGDDTSGRPTIRLGAINSDLAVQFQAAILLNASRRYPIAVLLHGDPASPGVVKRTIVIETK